MKKFPTLSPDFVTRYKDLTRAVQLLWLVLFGYLYSKIILEIPTNFLGDSLWLPLMIGMLLSPLVWHCASDKKMIDFLEEHS